MTGVWMTSATASSEERVPPAEAAAERRAPSPARPKIGLVCEITNGNLGNAAFEAATVQHILRYYPEAQLYVSSLDSVAAFSALKVELFPLNPDAERLGQKEARSPERGSGGSFLDTVEQVPVLGGVIRHAAHAAYRAWRIAENLVFWFRAARILRGFRLLILCGGGQLSDWWGGPWAHPYTLFMWSCLCRLLGTKLVVLNVAVEHVSSPLSRWFLTRVLRAASYRSFRDENSRRAVEEWGVPGPNHVYPDLAFSLAIPPRITTTTHSDRPIIGVSPMPYCDPRVWPVKDAAAYRKYLSILAQFSRALIDRGFAVMLLATQIRMDVRALRDLRDLIIDNDPTRAKWIIEPEIANVADFLGEMPKLELLVASRMHGLLLAQLVACPALAISYDDKCDALMAGLGLTEFCLDIQTVDEESLTARFDALRTARDKVTAQLQQRVAAYRDMLQNQYDQVFGTG